MGRFVIRLGLIFFTIVLLYQQTVFTNILTIFTFAVAGALSYIGLYRTFRDKILSLLADKILFASVLIAFLDLEILSSAVVAWVIGGLFIYSGIDLLQGSLHTEAMDFRSTWIKNLVQTGLVFLLLIITSLRGYFSNGIYSGTLAMVSYSLVILTAILIARCLLSERFRKLVKEA